MSWVSVHVCLDNSPPRLLPRNLTDEKPDSEDLTGEKWDPEEDIVINPSHLQQPQEQLSIKEKPLRIPMLKIVVDRVSARWVDGATLAYTEIDKAAPLMGSAFTLLQNPHATGGGCGCGSSFGVQEQNQQEQSNKS